MAGWQRGFKCLLAAFLLFSFSNYLSSTQVLRTGLRSANRIEKGTNRRQRMLSPVRQQSEEMWDACTIE
jgi:hypothetical protein